MSGETSDSGLPSHDQNQPSQSTNPASRVSLNNSSTANASPNPTSSPTTLPQYRSQYTTFASPTSPALSSNYPSPSLSPSQPQPAQHTPPPPLHLRPRTLVEQDRRATCVSDSDSDVHDGLEGKPTFQSPRTENEDLYDSVSDTSSAPILGNRRSRGSEVRTSMLPVGCVCGSVWHPGVDEEKPDKGALESVRGAGIPPVPVNSPRDEEGKGEESYHGPPGSEREWPHYWTQPVEEEGEEVVMCYGPVGPGSGGPPGIEGSGDLPRARSCDCVEEDLERQGNASTGSTHANFQSIDDVRRCPAARPAEAVGHNCSDSELAYWLQKRQEMLQEIQRVDERSSNSTRQPPLTTPRINMSRIGEANSMINLMHRSGFEPNPSWLRQAANLAVLAGKGDTYPYLAFAIAEFGEFFGEDGQGRDMRGGLGGDSTNDQGYERDSPGGDEEEIEPRRGSRRGAAEIDGAADAERSNEARDHTAASEASIVDQQQRSLESSTTMGVIDACEAVMGLMAIVGSRPSKGWCEQYDALTTNAQERGDLEPLVEYVRHEAESVSARNASARAAVARDDEARAARQAAELEEYRDSYDVYDLPYAGDYESSCLTPASASSHDKKGKTPDHFKTKIRGEYGVWIAKNYPDESESTSMRFVYSNIANSTHPDLSRRCSYETKEPFQVMISHYFDDLEIFARVFFVALAIKVTRPEKGHCGDTSVDVWVRSMRFHERFDCPARVQVFTAQGDSFDLDAEEIVAMVEVRLRAQLDEHNSRASGSMHHDGDSTLLSDGSATSSVSGVTLRRHYSDEFESSRRPDIHLTTEETREMHPSVFSERGITLVPLEDFPAIPEDPYNFVHYELQVGQLPSTVFVNCERCHKIMASFENVSGAPTVARRAETEPGDTYIVSSISSLGNVIDSVDRVKRVWVYVGTEKYFLRANEAGAERTHECISVQDGLGAAMHHQEREVAAEHSSRLDEPPRQAARLADVRPQEPEQPTSQPHLAPSADQNPPQEIPSMRMPSSTQFILVPTILPTAEMTAYPPCTIISVCEGCGFIHGVYQGVIRYRAAFRGPSESGHTVYLDIRAGLGAYIGRLCRVRYYEVDLMDGAIASFTAEEETEENMVPLPVPNQPVSHVHGMGLRGGAPPTEDWETDSETDMNSADDEEMGLRGGAGGEDSDSDDDDARHQPNEEWISTGSGAQAPSNHQASSSDVQSSGHPRKEWIPTGASDQHEQSQHRSCSCPSAKGKEPANDLTVASPHQVVPTNNPPPFQPPQDGSDVIPTWLQPGASSDPDQIGDTPVFSESYKKWLRDMYTRPTTPHCATDPAPGPSFQDFWRDREAGRPATMADGRVLRPRPQGEYHGKDVNEGEYIRLQPDDGHGDGDQREVQTRAQAKESDSTLLPRSSHMIEEAVRATHQSDMAPSAIEEARAEIEHLRLLYDQGEEEESEARFRALLTASHGSEYASHISQVPAGRDGRWRTVARRAEERPRSEQATVPGPLLVRILNNFLRDQVVERARESYNASVRDE